MTIRSGRGPRDRSDTGSNGSGMPVWRASNGRGGPPVDARPDRRNGEGRRGLPGPLKFLVFGGALAGIVLVALLTAFRPLISAGVVAWAWDNPGAITRFQFVADFVRDDLDGSLTATAGTNDQEMAFDVVPADTIYTLAPRLQQGGFIASQRAFLYTALLTDLGDKLQAGTFVLKQDMTPAQVVAALVQAKVTLTTVNVTFREGIRLEQQTALLQTIQSGVDPQDFYNLAKHPTPDILAANPWLQASGLPQGASLEGFLYPATYTLITSVSGGPFHVTTAKDLIQMELDKFQSAVGPDRENVPKARGMNFYQIVTLASIVQHETAQPSEKPLVAGVYQNRLDKLDGFAPLMGSEPTVIYAVDTANLRKIDFSQWQTYYFWNSIKTKIVDVQVPKDLQGYQTYQVTGLIPGPISSPTTEDIDAALNPDTQAGYLYFLAVPNTGTNVFAKTLAEQNANIKKYYPNGF
ncbi:MAG TPA: endolytic transglycosylase MltG [Candidatus Limnocylindrales bacterium]|nr:endolytic transglycosylase MltG [Candidatus Limnocylindrales bacterium]